MTERRRTGRVQSLDVAEAGAGFSRGVECSVRNMSSGGACLVFAQKQTALPDEFLLTIEPELTQRSCRLVWRSSYRVGVQFVTGC